MRNRRIGGYYAMGGGLVGWLALCGQPWTLILVWPAASMIWVAAGYLGLGARVYQKHRGRVAMWCHWLLAPTLWGQQLSLAYYRARSTAWSQVLPNVWIGRVLTESEAEKLCELGVTGVIDLTVEFSESAPLRRLNYHNLQLLDLTAPKLEELKKTLRFMEKETHSGGKIYIHCKVGYSRSAILAGAYLMSCGQCAGVAEVVEVLSACRPGIVVRPEALAALDCFYQDLNKGSAP